MSDQSQFENPETRDEWRERRREEKEQRRQARWTRLEGGWFGGVVLILLGVFFLLENTGLIPGHNWWALFILIPAAGAFTAAWNRYQDNGGIIDAAVRGSLFGGIVFAVICLAFLFDLTGALFWPALLILVGAGILVNAIWR